MEADWREDERPVQADLCASLADEADHAADIFEALANFHCRVAVLPWHPLASTALERAQQERRFAKEEREASAQLRARTTGARSGIAVSRNGNIPPLGSLSARDRATEDDCSLRSSVPTGSTGPSDWRYRGQVSLPPDENHAGVAQRARELAAAERVFAAKEAAIAEREEKAAAAASGPRQAVHLKAAKLHRAAQVAHERAADMQDGLAFAYRPKDSVPDTDAPRAV